ncbi:MAG: hypothetical protein ACK4UV_09410, partial [Ignavibacterium sp.]
MKIFRTKYFSCFPIRNSILIILFVFLSSQKIFAQKNDIETFKKLSSYLQTYIDYKRIPSISAGVYWKG